MKRGFTLIELLVVIAIIGILASVVMASLNSARAKARDAKRMEEVKQIQNALELYYANNGQYPVSGGATLPNSGWSTSTDSSWQTLEATLSTYLSDLPADPVNTAGTWGATGMAYSYYSLSYGCSQQWYMLIYSLESAQNPVSPGVTACDGTVFNYKSGSYGITVGSGK